MGYFTPKFILNIPEPSPNFVISSLLPFMLRKRKGKKRGEEKRKRVRRAVWFSEFGKAIQVKFEALRYFSGCNPVMIDLVSYLFIFVDLNWGS